MLRDVLKQETVVEKEGIFVAREIAEKTVWDTLAKENPTHAVISAADEDAARIKSEKQITHINEFVTTDTVLLDLGSGYGRVAKYLLPKQTLAGYIGVDSAYEMLSLFQKRYQHTPAEQATPALFVNADIHTLPINDASVDVVIVSAVFLHNHKSVVKQAMTELQRVLKPGGTMLVYSSFPRGYSLMGLQGNLYQGVLNMLGKPFKNGPVRYYSKRELKTLLSGFSDVQYVPYQFAVLPKSIIFFPKPLRVAYRTLIAVPINAAIEKIAPQFIKDQCGTYFDIIAKR